MTGSSSDDPVNAELYDPVSDSWSVTGRMIADRVMHSSIRLRDGRVLVAGGVYEDNGVSLTEVWDPVAGSWSPAGGIGYQEIPGMALLDDGEVLLVGTKRTQIFNPGTDRWRRVSDLVHQHKYGATVALGDGRVLVVGGEGTSECEIFDSNFNIWRPATSLNDVRAVPSAVILPTGQVIAAGGADGLWRIGGKVEIFDPLTESWTVIQPMGESRLAHTMTVLHDGSVLVTGGTTSVLSEPYPGQASVERLLMPIQTVSPRETTGRAEP